ncbi:MAG: flagellar protein FlgN [Treponema sp.]|nr:flagellar protein FlgN [Treponema sp.]
MGEVTQQEIDERVAILKHFRSLLQQQRNKFQEYLNVLEKQQLSIATEDTDAMFSHTELEQQVVSNIANLRKVIVPIHTMYQDLSKGKHISPAEDTEILSLQNELDNLQDKVIAQNKKNQQLLRSHMLDIKARLTAIKQSPYKMARSVYAQGAVTGQIVEVQI